MIHRATILLALAATLGCGRPTPAPPPLQTEAAWAPERIAKDPAGYLQYAQRRVREQTVLREKKLAELARRRKDVDAQSADLLRQMDEARNLANRLASAIQRAEDEARWPLQFAGRTLARDRALAMSEAIDHFIDQREPLAEAYVDAMRRLDQSERDLRGDIVHLGQVWEKLALDLERVRLNQGLAELTELRQTEAELLNFSADVSALTEDPLAGLVLGTKDKADLDELLKP